MNVKIDNQSILFKITEEELYVLQAGRKVNVNLSVATLGICFEILPHAQAETLSLASKYMGKETAVALRVSAQAVQRLVDMGKDRDGISINSGGNTLTLQVDMKSDNRPRKKD
jgi:hypothetical protein